MQIRFGDFVFDDGTRQLLCGPRECHLSRKAFDLLGLLLSQRPNVVTKNRIRDRLWPGTVIADTTLATVVAELRTVLEEDPKQPRWLRTARGVGYAFCGQATVSTQPRGGAAGSAVKLRLVLKDREVQLHEGENLLGRVEHGLVWLESLTVSRRHARIVLEGGRAVLEDLGSKNGTFLRGRRISTPTPLSDGDEIRLGQVTMILRALPADRSTLSEHGDRR